MNPSVSPPVSGLVVRSADEADGEPIAAIYAEHVLRGTATFETVPPNGAEMGRRMKAIRAAGLPWIVAEVAGEIIGYAYAGPFRARAAYRFTVEDSLYLEPAWKRRGIGRRLLSEVIVRSEQAGARQMIAVIGGSENEASVGLHRALGFQPAGTLRRVGLKFGRWIDVVLMQRTLGEGDASIPGDAGPLGVFSE